MVPTGAHAEHIDSFATDISISKDSSFTATERITYTFTEPRHGIFRCIPTLHHEQPRSFFKERYIDIEIGEITMDGGGVPYTIEDSDEMCVKIGNPNVTIEGTHIYSISYRVVGAVSYEQNGGAELYWNVTGNEWEVPMNAVAVTVTSQDQILLRERACYRGMVGETSSCEIRENDDGTPHFSGRNFSPHEGLTIAQALNRSVITYDVRERVKMMWVVLGILGFGIPVLIFSIYQYKTKFKTERAIIAQYEPYPEVKPMYAGFLFDRRLDPRDITAGIVYLAKEGFLKIRKTESKVFFFFEVDDYEMTLLRPFTDTQDVFEQNILKLIFWEGAEVGKKVTLSELKNNYAVRVSNAKIFRELTEGLKEDMKERGFYSGFSFSSLFNKTTVVMLIVSGISAAFISQFVFVMYIVIGIIVLIALADGRRTTKGYEALDHLKGFKDFLSVTEKERYIFHNAPEINAEQFMEFLPYAIAFGVEKQWAKTFESITIPNPEWYDSGSGIHTFNAVSLSESLGGFSTAFASSSGTSASSGGGHSGGGSGGGGGGSW